MTSKSALARRLYSISLWTLVLMLAAPAALALPMSDTAPWFEDHATAAGIGFVPGGWMLGEDNQYFPEIMHGGACWFDHDRDGWVDLFLVGAPYRNASHYGHSDPHSELYRNEGDGTFTAIGAIAGVDRRDHWDMSCSAADYDSDGWVDLFIAGYDEDVLYRNQRDGTFRDVTAAANISDAGLCAPFPCWGHTSAWGDADNDGDLDLYVVDYVEWDLDHNLGNAPEPYSGQRNIFWENQGNGTFADTTEQHNLSDDPQRDHGRGLGVVWYDHDRDGCLDLYIASDQSPASLLHNDCNGWFTDVGASAGVDDDLSGMGIAVGDTNDDGWSDLYKTHYQGEHNTYYVNAHDGTYTDSTAQGELANDDPYVGWGTGFYELNNDGHVDLWVTNGHTFHYDDYFGVTIDAPQQNLVFLGLEGSGFQDVTAQAGPGLHIKKVGRGSAAADYDQDGDLDMAVHNNGNGTADLLRNGLAASANRHWLQLQPRLPGTANWQAIGSVVTLETSDGHQQTRMVRAGGSYLSQDDTLLHFGLGPATTANVTVRWPNGTTDAYSGLAADHALRLLPGGNVVQDLLGPTTTIQINGAPVADDWYTTNVTLEITAEDHGPGGSSGVAVTRLRIDDGPWKDDPDPHALTEGVYDVSATSIDLSDNPEVLRHARVFVDTTPPTTWLSTDVPVQPSGWYTESPLVSMLAHDPTSGVAVLVLALDDDAFTPYAAPFSLDDGTHGLGFHAIDHAGNAEPTQRQTLRVDTEPPHSNVTIDGVPGTNGWWVGNVEVDVVATDATSGVAAVHAHFGDGEWQPWAGPRTLDEGQHDLWVRAQDEAGNREATQHIEIDVDTTAPLLEANVSGSIGDDGWVVSDATLDAHANDTTSGVSTITFRIDNGAWQELNGTVPLQDGTSRIDVRAQDMAGRTSATQTLTPRIDTQPPDVSVVEPPASGTNGWHLAPAAPNATAEDHTSGVSSIEVRVDDGPWSPPGDLVVPNGIQEVTARAVDAAGHRRLSTPQTIQVDTDDPLLDHAVDVAPAASGWYTTTPIMTINGTDATSGIHRIAWRSTDDPWNDVDAPVALADGNHTLWLRANDTAGRTTRTGPWPMPVDTTPPTASFAFAGMHLERDDWVDIVRSTTFELDAEDATSGLAAEEMRMDDTDWQPAATFTIDGADGFRTAWWRARDVAGNPSPATAVQLRSQNDAPPPLSVEAPGSGTIHGQPGSIDTGTKLDAVWLGCTPMAIRTAAHVTGTASLSVSVDGARQATWQWPSWTPAGQSTSWTYDPLRYLPGLHQVDVTAADHHGNTATWSQQVWSAGAGTATPCPGDHSQS